MRALVVFVAVLTAVGCGPEMERAKVRTGPITESVYASGIVESKGQHEVFATVSGVVDRVFVKEGDTIAADTPLLSIVNDVQRLSTENARAAAAFAAMDANAGKLREAEMQVELAKSRLDNDSLQLDRQKRLWQQQIGSQTDLESRQLAYDRALVAYRQAVIYLSDLQRQLEFSSTQAQTNLRISDRLERDFMPRSKMAGVVYQVLRKEGELVGPQTPLLVLGQANAFVLKMQVDEQDIFLVECGQKVFVTLESYRDTVFEAKVTEVVPLMNPRTRTFEVEAEFVHLPTRLAPNITFEANIVLREKPSAMLIPRRFLVGDSMVVLASGDTVAVQTGLQDLQYVEVISGVSADDEVEIVVP